MTDKQKLFVEAYLGQAHFNATAAARIAGYADPEKESWRIRQSPEVQEAISQRVSQYAMSAEEVLAELSDIARNSSLMPLLDAQAYGRPEIILSYKNGELKPETRFVKKFSTMPEGISIEVHDRMAALVQLGKFHGLWIERQDVTSGGQPLAKVYEGVDTDKV